MSTMVDLLRDTADATPDRIVLSVQDGPCAADVRDLTAARWWADAGAVASALTPGTRVLLLLGPSTGFVTALAGIMRAGACAVPVAPPVNSSDRFVAVARDAEVDVVLTDRATRALACPIWERSGAPSVRWLDVEDLTGVGTTDGGPDRAPCGPAVLQYTSGSTGRPKGVVIGHDVLGTWLDVFADRTGLPADSTVVSWSPVHHALGLAVALTSLATGGRTHLLRPEDVLGDPMVWLRAVSAAPGRVFGGAAPFAYQLCVDATTPQDRSGLDLSRWDVALIGSERIRSGTMDDFAEAFGPAGFRSSAFFPSYGMSEIMMVAGHRGPGEPVRVSVDAGALERRRAVVTPDGSAERSVELVGCGPPTTGAELVVVDPDRRTRCAPDEVGELWVRGPVVADSYWKQPELTAATFEQYLADGDGPFLRTGDLVFFHEGELVVCGRLGEVMIVRGRNLYPQDVEATVAAVDPALDGRPAGAFAVDGPDGDVVVVVAEVDPDGVEDPDRLADEVRRAATAEHEVEIGTVALVEPGRLPLTSIGKVRRSTCRTEWTDGTLAAFARADAPTPAPSGSDAPLGGLLRALPDELRAEVAAADLRRRIGELLGRDPAEVPADRPLVELGLDSLRLMTLRGELVSGVGAAVALERVAASTVSELSRELAAAAARAPAGPGPQDTPAAAPDGPDTAAPTVPEPDAHEPFRLTALQHAYLAGSSGEYALGGVSTHYYTEFDAAGLDMPRLRRALALLTRRHAMLRAVVSADGTQRVVDNCPDVPVHVTDLREAPSEQRDAHLALVRERTSHQVVEPGTWPLLDVRVTLLPGGVARVHVSIDLLIADLWSLRVLSRDWKAFYDDPEREPDPPAISFRRYLELTERDPSADDVVAAREHWTSRLDTLPRGPELPLRRWPQPGEPVRFRRRAARLDAGRWARIEERARASGVTGTGVLVAAYATVLAAWSRWPRFTLALPTFTREPVHEQVHDVVGDATAVTLLEVDVAAAESIEQLARSVQSRLWGDLEHRAFDGVEVLRELGRHRDDGELFAPVVFASAVGHAGSRPSEAPDTLPLAWLGEQVYALSQTPQVLLDHQVLEDADGLAYNWDSVDDLFADGVLDSMFEAYRSLLERLSDTGAGAKDAWSGPAAPPLPAAHPAAAVNETGGPVPDGLLHDPLLRRCALRPDAVAVEDPDGPTTYADLDDRSARLAAALRAHGVATGELVAVEMPKCADQVVAVLGVLRAGGAYLPVDPDLPEARRDALLEAGGCRVVVCADPSARDWPGAVTAVAARVHVAPDTAPPPVPPSDPAPTDLAYVIFTSGSTGAPKGVAVSHRAALNTCVDVSERFAVGPDDRVLGLSSLSFDLSVYDVFGVLGAGGTLVLPRPGTARDPGHWMDLVARHGVTLWNSVPALMAMLAEYVGDDVAPELATLRTALLSGDWIPVTLPDRIRAAAPGCRVVSLGGATEAAIWSICYEIGAVDPGWESVPYGRPMRNQRFHVLDARLRECPEYVVGELYIAGAGLAEGYFGDPGRTRERFVHHPRTGERLYRTGDMGRWCPDGTIEFLGREDGQVKVGGFRIELGEIEAALLAHPRVRSAVASAPGSRHHRTLVAHVVLDPPQDPDAGATAAEDVREAVAERLPAYMVPQLVVVDDIPLTANGKVDRSALAAPGGEPDPDAPIDLDPRQRATVGRLRTWVAELLALDADDVGLHTPLPRLGLDSLRAIRLRNTVRAELGAVLPMRTLLGGSVSIAELAVVTGDGGTAAEEPLAGEQAVAVPDPDRRHEPFGLTELQQAYVIGRSTGLDLGGVGTYFYAEYLGEHDPDRLVQAFRAVVERHDMLRASVAADGEQRVLPDTPPAPVTRYDLRGADANAVEAHLEALRTELSSQVLPLDGWPLFDLRLTLRDDGGVDRVHTHLGCDLLVADVWSVGLMLGQWEQAYVDGSLDLPPLELTFRDYLAAAGRAGASDRDERYWTERLDTLPSPPRLPVRPPSEAGPPRFERRDLGLDPRRWAQLRASAAEHDVTPNAVLLAAFATVVAAWSEEPRFLLNIPTFNRSPLHDEVDAIVGDFTSVTLLEVDVEAETTPARLAARIQERLADDLDHRSYSGIRVLRELNHRRGGGWNAPVVFTSALGQGVDDRGDLPMGWLGEQVFGRSQTPQVLLDNQVYERDGALVVHWDVVVDRFDDGVVDGMGAAFRHVLDRCAAPGGLDRPVDPTRQAHLDVVLRANDTASDPVPGGLADPVVDRARRDPDRPAVVGGSRDLSYGELLGHAQAAAARLRDAGVGTGEPVAVSGPPGSEQVVAVLAVQLAGGAHVVPAPGTVASGTGARVVVGAGADGIDVPHRIRVDLDEDPGARDVLPAAGAESGIVCLLTDAGGTVAVPRRAAVETCADLRERWAVGPGDRVLAGAAPGGAGAVLQTFVALGAGAALVVPPPDPGEWAGTAAAAGATVWVSSPERARTLPDDGLALRLLLLVDDAVQARVLDELGGAARQVAAVARPPGVALAAAVAEAAPVVRNADTGTVLGRPLRNQRLHVLDRGGRERPVGVVGELCVAGDGLAGDHGSTAGTGERLCRTGLRARRMGDGAVGVLGDAATGAAVNGNAPSGDGNGVRAALLSHPWVADAAVTGTGSDATAHVVPATATRVERPTAAPHVVPDLVDPGDRASVLFDEADRVEFKLARHGVRTDLDAPAAGPEADPVMPVPLPPDGTTSTRTSRRRFADRPVGLAELARVLAELRSEETDTLPRYRYASAGNAYAVQAYLAVEDGRVDGLPGGTWYYDPAVHRLVPVGPGARVGPDVALGVDAQAADTAAFALFLVADLDAVRPLYGERVGRDVCLVETGLMVSLLEQRAERERIGTCQVRVVAGGRALHAPLRLDARHEVLHAVLGGALLAPAEAPATAPDRDEPVDRAPDAVRDAVRRHLAARLPGSQVPGEVVVVDRLPGAGAPDPASPGGDLESLVADVLTEAVGTDPGRDRPFFEVGADSVTLVRAHRLLQARLGRRFPLTDMFENATVRALASALSARSAGGTSGDPGSNSHGSGDELLSGAAWRADRVRSARRRRATARAGTRHGRTGGPEAAVDGRTAEQER